MPFELDDKRIGTIFLALVILAKLPTMGLEYHWDATFYAKQAALYAKSPFAVSEGRIVHVPLLQWLTASMFFLFGESAFLAHFVIALFSFVGVYYAYLLGRELGDKLSGLLSAVLVFMLPAYFAFSGQYLFDIPVAALSIASIFYFIKRDDRKYAVSALMMVFLKETGVILAGAAFLYSLAFERKKAVYSMPALALPLIWHAWIGRSREVTGFLVNSGLENLPLRFFASLYDVFFINYTWVLLLPVFYALYKGHLHFKSRSWAIPFSIACYVGFFSLVPVFLLPRYFLPATALLAIVSGVSLSHSIKSGRRAVLIAFVISTLFISAYYGHDGLKGKLEDPLYRAYLGWEITSVKNGEMTLEYIDFVSAEKEALDYIMSKYQGKKIVATFPIYEESLRDIDVGSRKWKKNDIEVLPPERSGEAAALVKEPCCPIDIPQNWVQVASFGKTLNRVAIYEPPKEGLK